MKAAAIVIEWIKKNFSQEVRAIHELRTHPKAFSAVRSGDKRHEVRPADRDFQVGDWLYLREWDPARRVYTGRQVFREITHITQPCEFGLPKKLCVLSVR